MILKKQEAAVYSNIKMILFDRYYSIESIEIHQKINEHSTMKIIAVVSEESALKYETETINNKTVKLLQKTEEDDIILFNGMIKNWK